MFFSDLVFEGSSNNQGISVKDLIAKFDIFLAEIIESENIDKLMELYESSLEYKEIEKELNEITDDYFRTEFISRYHDPIENISIKVDILEIWIKEPVMLNDEEKHFEFYKIKNEMLTFAIEELKKV